MFGLGMIQLSTISWERLPNNPTKWRKTGTSIALLLTGGVLLGSFWHHEEDFFTRRAFYRETLERHNNEYAPEIEVHEINYEQEGKIIQAESRIVAVNRTGKRLDNITLYLNPGLKVSDIHLASGDKLPFSTDFQAITIDHPLSPSDSVELRMEYAGTIDEAVGYLDFPDEKLKDTKDRLSLKCRTGRHFALVGKDFTWLVPEMMWYPSTVPPVNPTHPYSSKKDFTKYTLRAKAPDGQNIISQGHHTKQGKVHIFRNEEKRPGISLCMGDFRAFQQTIDSVIYTLYCSPQQANIVKQDKKEQNEWQEIIKTERLKTDHSQGKRYHYKRFSVVELPLSCTSYYRNWKMGSEFTQPEIAFMREKTSPDKLYTLFIPSATDYLKTWKTLLTFKKIPFFNENIIEQGNPYYISPLYHDQLNYLHSSDFPILHYAMSAIIDNFNDTRFQEPLLDLKTAIAANYYLERYSLQEIDSLPGLDPYITATALTRKIKDLVYRMELMGIKTKDLVNFTKRFKEASKFRTADYAEFKHEFEREFHRSPDSLLHAWYTDKGLTTFLVADCQKELVKVGEKYMTRFECAVFNNGQTDGLVCLQAKIHLGEAAFVQAMQENRKTYKKIFHVYPIKAYTGKRIILLLDSCQNADLDLNLSRNLPTKYPIPFGECNYKHTSPGVEMITRKDLTEKGVVIADNSDSNFRVITPEALLDKWFSRKQQLVKTEYSYHLETWETLITPAGYGLTEKSYLNKLGGKGYFGCEWEANLPEDGIYEIFVFTQCAAMTPLPLEYTVFYEDKQEIVDITPTIRVMHWISLGEYSCRAGKNKVHLSDKGEKYQIIVADAVKWVKKR